MAEINSALQTLLTSVTVAVIAAIGAIAIAGINIFKQWVVAKIQTIDNEEARKALSEAVNRVDDIVCTVVTSIEQEEKQEILKAMEDGKVNREELLNLKSVAVNRVKEQLLPDTVKLLEDSFGDITSYISQKVSQQVFAIKQN